MPSPTHITTYAADALALLTSRYQKPRPDPPENDLDIVVRCHDINADLSMATANPTRNVLVVFEALSADRTCPIPTLAIGQAVTIRDRDGSLATHDIIVTSGLSIRIGATTFASPYHLSLPDFAPGSSIKFEFDGVELVAV